jgi:circadian clock protein KaiC
MGDDSVAEQDSDTIDVSYGDRVPTGIPGLDRILMGGLLRGSAYIVQGAPGLGKTVLANQVACNRAREGERVLYLTLLSESHAQMFVHLRSLAFFDPSLVPDQIYYSSGYAALDQDGLAGLLRLTIRELRRFNARFLVLDGLFVAHALSDTENDFRRFVHELQGQLSLLGVTALLLTNERRDPSSAEFTMVDGWIELTEHLFGARTVRDIQIRKMRGTMFLTGRHKYAIQPGGLTVFPRLEAITSTHETDPPDSDERLSTGLAVLDEMLHGGLPAKSATLVHGPSGGGKTSIGLHFLAAARAEEPALLFGFYEAPRMLCQRAAKFGIDLDGLLRAGTLEILWRPPTEMLADELALQLLDAVRARGVRRLFLDGLGALRESFVYPQRFHAFMTALGTELRALGVTSLLSQEAPQLFQTEQLQLHDVSAVVDNLVLLQHIHDGRVTHRQLSVIKLRGSSFDSVAREFEIGSRGIELRPAAHLARRARRPLRHSG